MIHFGITISFFGVKNRKKEQKKAKKVAPSWGSRVSSVNMDRKTIQENIQNNRWFLRRVIDGYINEKRINNNPINPKAIKKVKY